MECYQNFISIKKTSILWFSFIKYLSVFIILFLFSSCSSEPKISEFDLSKVKRVYANNPIFMYEKFAQKSHIKMDSLRLGYNILTNNIPIIVFRSPSKCTVKIFSPFSPKKPAIELDYEFKIIKDSIVKAKLLNRTEHNYSGEFEEVAILKSYSNDYNHIVFKPIKGKLKGLNLKIDEKSISKYNIAPVNAN